MAGEKVPPRTLRKPTAAAPAKSAQRGPAPRSLGAAKPAAKPAARPARAAKAAGFKAKDKTAKVRGSGAPIGERFVTYISTVFGGQSLLFSRILTAALILVVYGCLMVLSASSIDSIKQYGNPLVISIKQIIFAVGGFFALAFASSRSEEFWEKWALRLFIITSAMQLYAVIPGLGHSVNGNREWIQIPGVNVTIQPSEFLKLALILNLAIFLTRRRPYLDDPRSYTWPALVMALIPMVLIIAGSDLGTTIVVAMIALVLVWLSGPPGWHFRIPLLIAAVAGIGSLFVGTSRIGRILAWLDPNTSDQANNYAWQSQHGIWALANSHIIGQGLGMSSLKWSWIPEVENDYIFAIIGEELGIIGAMATIALFLLLGYWIVQVGIRAADSFGRYVSFGVACWLVLQASINIAVVLKVLPVLGVPLPLISAGGSSLVADMAAIGVVLSIERRNHEILDGGMRRPIRTAR